MSQFFLSALPWVVLATLAAMSALSMRHQRAAEADNAETGQAAPRSAMYPGLFAGALLGLCIGCSLLRLWGSGAVSYGVCIGALAGMYIGSKIRIKK